MTFVKTDWNEGAAPGISAAQLDRMEQGIYDAHYPPSCRLRRMAVEELAVASLEALNWTTEDYDSAGMHAVNSPSVVIPVAGKYRMSTILWYENAGVAIAYIRHNRGGVLTDIAGQRQQGGSFEISLAFSTSYECLAGDILTVLTEHSAGGDVLASVTGHHPQFVVEWAGT